MKNYSYKEIQKIYENIANDLKDNPTVKQADNLKFLEILNLYKQGEKNKKKETKKKIGQISYFNELIDLFGKDIAYKVVSETYIKDEREYEFENKALLIEKCIKQKITFLETLKFKIVFMGSKIEDCYIYIYVDNKNYLVANIKELLSYDSNAIKKTTKDYYINMNLEEKLSSIFENPLAKILFLQITQFRQ